MAGTSFLASVKDGISECFAGVYDEISEVCPDEEKLTASLTGLQKAVWKVVEPALKTSFINGKKSAAAAANGGRRPKDAPDTPAVDTSGEPSPKSNPFRKSRS